MEPKEKKAFEPSGLVPRSIVRTFERFRQQLLPGSETAAIREYRISRYQVLVSARCLFTLLIIPIATNWLVSSWLLSPLVEHFWNTQQNEIFLNSYQEERAFAELESFSEKLFFESLLNTTNTINVNFTPYVQKFSSSESQPFAYPVRVRGMTSKMYAKEALQLYQSSTLQGICTESSVTNSFLPKTNLCNLNLKNSSAFDPAGVKALSETWDTGVRDIADSTLSNVGQCAYLLPLQGIGLVLNLNDLNEYSIKNLREPYVHGVPQIGQIGIPFFQTQPTTTNLLTNSETFLPNLRFGLVPQLLEIENERTVHKSSIFRGTPTQSKATDSVGVKAFSKVWGIQSKEGHKSLICPCTTHFTKERGQGCSYQQEQRGTHSSASNSSIASIVLPQKGIKGSTLTTAGGKPLVIAGDKFVEVYRSGKASSSEGSLLSVPLGSTYDNSLKIKEKVQNKILELAIYYNQQTIISITNIVGDVVSLMTLGCLFIWMRPEITILKSFLIEAIYSLSDTTKSFLLILLTDLLVGFHSPRGWETALELLLKHFGLPENQDFVFLFVATFPVLLDTVFKYWIFRHLNKISPSTVATYHSMIE